MNKILTSLTIVLFLCLSACASLPTTSVVPSGLTSPATTPIPSAKDVPDVLMAESAVCAEEWGIDELVLAVATGDMESIQNLVENRYCAVTMTDLDVIVLERSYKGTVKIELFVDGVGHIAWSIPQFLRSYTGDEVSI